MPDFHLSPGAALYYRDDDFTAPWSHAETALFLHGFAENGSVWNGWVPDLGRRFRLLRPDMRGFGRSTPMPADYAWSLDGIIDDYVRLADRLRVERFHLVGAKIAGAIALRFAALYRQRVLSVTVAAARLRGREALGGRSAEVIAQIERGGVGGWARATNARRLGSAAPPEMQAGWIDLMALTPASTAVGFVRNSGAIDTVPDLPNVACPTLVIATEGSGINDSVAAVRAWQTEIPNSELLVLPYDSYHIAATHPRECAQAMLGFLERNARDAASAHPGSWRG
jgi:3-oxoadipate enol-lactonase